MASNSQKMDHPIFHRNNRRMGVDIIGVHLELFCKISSDGIPNSIS